jgi:hypothetical protein
MNYKTEIDTIAIQIDCNYAEQQREILDGLLRFTTGLSLFIGHKDSIVGINMIRREHYIYANNTTVATINTGVFRAGSYIQNNYAMKYYINIKFAGLKTYNEILDKASHDYLLKICAFLNTRGIAFKLTELDVCIDSECAFDNILAICTKKSPKTKYNKLTDTQMYNSTTYIEDITAKKYSKAVLRAYTYDKRYKEKLSYDLTRFEIKLQPKYFNKYGFSVASIEKALDRYHVMYFESVEYKNEIITSYSAYKTVRKREIKKLKFNEYRLLPDMQYINNFIYQLQNINDSHFYVMHHGYIPIPYFH